MIDNAAMAGLGEAGETTPASTPASTPDATPESHVLAALALLEAACAAVADLDLDALARLDRPSDELVEAGARVETARRQLGAFDTAYVHALESAAEWRRRGATSLVSFLSTQLRITPAQAKRRVRTAQLCGPQPGVTPEERRPVLPELAAARRAGLVGDEQASLIVSALEKFPTAPSVGAGRDRECDGEALDGGEGPEAAELAQAVAQAVAEAEVALVATAATSPPAVVASRGRQLLEAADPDRLLRDFAYRRAQRGGSLIAHPGGGGRLIVDLCDVGLEKWQTVLDPLTKPLPEGPEGPDPRTPRQRFADAVEAVADRILASGDLPASGGTPAAMVFYLTPEQAETRKGMALTDNGNQIPVPEAFKLADQCVINTIIRTAQGVPLSMGRLSRLATPSQTRALALRDRGCTFPGCTRPPSWCQRHHVRDWLYDGQTDLDNLTLVCSYHHANFAALGWQVQMREGLPRWIPPKWRDPDQKPIRNTAHDHPTLDTSAA